MIDKTISHYRILDKIGSGGMGEVYLAEDTKLDRKVALKFLPKHLTADNEAKSRFEREAKAAAALNHPNIVTVHEIGEHEGQVFIAMEYVEGQTLKELIAANRPPSAVNQSPIAPRALPLAQVIEIVSQLASGLAAAHSKGIVHRDIKPQNILIDKESRVKILDFGLAKLKGISSLTKESSTLGTVHYMSPEQTMGKDVDHGTDIWSLGVVIFEMLTGKLPFKGDYEQAVIYSILNEEPTSVTVIRKDIPPEFDHILEKALAKDRDERYSHLTDLIIDLRRIGKDSSPELTAAAPAKKKAMPRILYPALAIGLATVVIVGFLWLKNWRPSTPVIDPTVLSSKPSIAVFYFENKTGRKDLDIWRDGLANLLITDLSQSKYLRILSEEQMLSLMKGFSLDEFQKYSSDEIKQIALRGGCPNIVRGYYLQTGKTFIITASLQNAASGDIIDSFKASGEGEESITTSIDEITRRIKLAFPLTTKQLANDVDVGIGQVTTRSPEALKYYLAGRKYHYQGEMGKSIDMMNKAVELDPAFAMAYYSLALSYSNLVDSKKEEENTQKALQYSDRVSIKEREIIRADAEYNPVKRINILRRIMKDYPDNEVILRALGRAYMRTGDNAERLKVHTKAYSLSPDAAINCGNAADSYISCNPSDYAQAEALYREFSARHPDARGVRYLLAVCYTVQRKWDLAEQEIEKLYMLNPQDEAIPILRGGLAIYQGDWDRAEAEHRKIPGAWGRINLNITLALISDIQGKTKAALKHWREAAATARTSGDRLGEKNIHYYLVNFNYREGNFREALAEVDQAERSFQTPPWWYLVEADAEFQLQRALVYTAMGDKTQGEKYFSLASEALSKEDKGTRAWQSLVSLYRGQMEWAIGNYGQGIELLQRFLSLIPYQHCDFWDLSNRRSDCLYMIASAHARMGDLQNAIGELEEIPTLTAGRIWNPQTLARSYLLAGQLYQKVGQRDKALEKYRLFVDLWKDCDPPLRPLVNEARREMAKLEKQG